MGTAAQHELTTGPRATPLPVLPARRQRARTISRKKVKQLVAGERPDPIARELARLRRPRTRADCVDGPRPCPFLTCRYHLAADVTTYGGLRLAYPDLGLEDLAETCALDVADRGGVPLEEVGRLLGVTRERVRQIEMAATGRMRVLLGEA